MEKCHPTVGTVATSSSSRIILPHISMFGGGGTNHYFLCQVTDVMEQTSACMVHMTGDIYLRPASRAVTVTVTVIIRHLTRHHIARVTSF